MTDLHLAYDPIERKRKFARFVYLNRMHSTLSNCKLSLDAGLQMHSHETVIQEVYRSLCSGIENVKKELEREKEELQSIS